MTVEETPTTPANDDSVFHLWRQIRHRLTENPYVDRVSQGTGGLIYPRCAFTILNDDELRVDLGVFFNREELSEDFLAHMYEVFESRVQETVVPHTKLPVTVVIHPHIMQEVTYRELLEMARAEG